MKVSNPQPTAIHHGQNEVLKHCIPNYKKYCILGLGVFDILACLCVLVFRGFPSMRIEAILNFGEYLVPIVVPLTIIAYTADVGMVVFLSFERYLGAFHLNPF